MKSHTRFALLVVVIATLLIAGCAKKTIAHAAPAPTPPPPAAPTIDFSASPTTVEQGSPAVLTWRTSNASEVTIAGVGTVPSSGSRSVTPSQSTTYQLMAWGAGGDRKASARVTVLTHAATAAPPAQDDLFAQHVKDIYFDYDRYSIRPDQAPNAEADKEYLLRHPKVGVVIEGHCDERGSEEYNLALGDSRANAVKSQLVTMGVSPDRLRTVSYGKERPFCTEENEQCWQQNRRDHFQQR